MRFRKITGVLLSFILLCLLVLPATAGAASNVKNVILMIGDGMGENHLLLAREHGVDLFMDKAADAHGFSRTRSYSDLVTDSAAGGTALACGIRTRNYSVGVYPFDRAATLFTAKSLTEVAHEKGMKTGVVTTDKTMGATPADFTAHTSARGNYEDISAQQVKQPFDLIWGNADGILTKAAVEAQGWTWVTTRAEMEALKAGSRSFAQFSGDTWRTTLDPEGNTPMLEGMTKKAIALLSANAPNGFFLMVEGAHIDKMSHKTSEGVHYASKVERTVDAMKGFDLAIKAAVDFARRDKHTIVLVTADHETGNLYPENGVMTFHSGSHTGSDVPVLVYCARGVVRPGETVDNYEIPIRLARALGWDENTFPSAGQGKLFTFFLKIKQMLEQIRRLAGQM